MPRRIELPISPAGTSRWPWSPSGDTLADQAQVAWPRISIVTPSFNQGAFIEETLRSVLLQGYPNLEYIVMDGGSIDDSQHIIQRYAAWLDVWVCEPDGGQSHALNKGFARATGDVFGWLNSDDILMPGALFAVAGAFLNRPWAVLVHGQAEHISPDGARLPNCPVAGPYDRRWLLEQSNLIPQPAAYVTAEAWREAGGVDEGLHYCMDWDLWLRLRPDGRAIFLAEVLAQMRLHAAAKFQVGGRRMHAELLRVIRRHGGLGLPHATRRRLVADHVALAMEAYCVNANATGRNELEYVLDHEPKLRTNPDELSAAVAAEAWRLWLEQCVDPINLVEAVRRDLDVSRPDGLKLRRHTLGLLYAALAQQSFERGQSQRTLQLVWQALRNSTHPWTNRGLWSLALKAVLNPPWR